MGFCDKIFQQMSLPRIIIMGVIFIMSVVLSFICWPALGEMVDTAWPSVVILGVGYTQGIVYEKALRGVDLIARSFWEMFLNLFRLRGRTKIHTYGTWGKTIN